MRTLTAAMVVTLTMATAHGADLSAKEANRIREAATVLREIHTVPDKDIPDELWARAECVIVVPSLKRRSCSELQARRPNGAPRSLKRK